MGRIEIYQEFCSGALATADIHQLNLIMEVLGTPRDEFMLKISSESVSHANFDHFLTLMSINRTCHYSLHSLINKNIKLTMNCCID